jgi:hypothetical protein
VTAIIDFIIPADYYNQTLLITCQHYAHGTLYYNIRDFRGRVQNRERLYPRTSLSRVCKKQEHI